MEMDDQESLMEQLASVEHSRWADWQKYVHEKATKWEDGTLIIPPNLVERWERQIKTPYHSLTAEEKESDREQVRRYMPLIDNHIEREVAKVATGSNASTRAENDYLFERASLDNAHYHNEVSRDTFIGLGHTALFASSIAFTGDAVPLEQASLKWLLLTAWVCNVVGLASIAFSFGAARKAIDARRAALNDGVVPSTTTTADHSNGLAVWAFMLSLLALFGFLIFNVAEVNMAKDRASTPDHSDYGTFGATPPPRAPAYNPRPNPGTGVIPSPRPPQPNPTPSPAPAPTKN